MRFLSVILAIAIASACNAQLNTSLLGEMKWRMIGPFRGGRTVAATGIPDQPNVFYIGVNDGGVWKTDDFGRTWDPIFDNQPTGSIGALAVAPSDPNVIYVGSGEGIQRPDLSVGDGMYKSTDAGKTWEHLGLRDGQQIGSIIVDPNDPNRLFVAVLGHPYGPNDERGVYRSIDGGKNFQKVLFKDKDTGAIELAFDPSNSQTIYADLFAARQGPWENGTWLGPNSGLFKSTDGGETWTKLTKGLPTFEEGLGRIGFGISASSPKRMYAVVQSETGGVFRSDDAGESWRQVNDQNRLWGRGDDFAEIKVDSKDPDTVYICNTSTYRSTDAGVHWAAIKGAPGGDDYHTVWVNSKNTDIILLACDQGAVVSVNRGRTWSSWYNQPTAQLYHVATDNQFPYNVYAGQQESGSVGTASRGNDGGITFREWHPVGAEEYAYIAPDPLNPNTIYGGKVTKFDKATGQIQDVGPDMSKYRALRTAPLLFSPVDPHTLYFAANVLFKTTDGAHSWQAISPDLSRPEPEGLGVFAKPQRRGVIYAVGPSYVDANVIWAGTDDGLVHITRDGGKTWSGVTPPGLSSWSKISQIDAGRFDVGTAFVAVNRIRTDDLRPHVYRTHDFGKTWTEIDNGLPDNEPVNVVRQDRVDRALLFAGTERAVYCSDDDGEHWQPLRLNMPATSIRDLVVHGDDLVVATHGRSFWILDDVQPLRSTWARKFAQWGSLGPSAPVVGRPQDYSNYAGDLLIEPPATYQVQNNRNSDTPLPPEEPAGQNPPDGAIIDYVLSKTYSKVQIEISDAVGNRVALISSDDPQPLMNLDTLNVPAYWLRQYRPLPTTKGFHRFIWDMRYSPLTPGVGGPSMSANFRDTPWRVLGARVPPGVYWARFEEFLPAPIRSDSADSLRMRNLVFHVLRDPRLSPRLDPTDLHASVIIRSFKMEQICVDAAKEVEALRAKLSALPNQSVQALIERLDALKGVVSRGRRRRAVPTGGKGFLSLASQFAGLMDAIDGSDAPPIQSQMDAFKAASAEFAAETKEWEAVKTEASKMLGSH